MLSIRIVVIIVKVKNDIRIIVYLLICFCFYILFNVSTVFFCFSLLYFLRKFLCFLYSTILFFKIPTSFAFSFFILLLLFLLLLKLTSIWLKIAASTFSMLNEFLLLLQTWMNILTTLIVLVIIYVTFL